MADVVANRLTHVVWAVREENLESAADFWRKLGSQFKVLERADYGLRIYFDWNTGIELIAAVGPGEPADRVRDFVEEHGEGLFTVDFGVADLKSAIATVEASGLHARALPRTMLGDEPWFDDFITLIEARILDRDDLKVMMAEIKPRRVAATVPRVSHVGYAVRAENMPAMREFWESNFGAEFEEVRTRDPGLRVLYAPDAGIELIAVTDDRAPEFVSEPMARLGEGPFLTAFAVADLNAAVSSSGLEPVATLSYTGEPDWVDCYERLEQAILPEVHGMRVVLTEMKRRPRPEGTA